MPDIHFETSDRLASFNEGDEVNILRVSIRNDCGLPWRCASGNCGTDLIRIVDGQDQLSTPRRRERERLGDLLNHGYRLACQTYTAGDVTVEWDPEQTGLDVDSPATQRLKARWLGAADTT